MKKTLLIISAVITLLLVTSCNQDYEEIANTANFEKSFTRGDFYVPDIDFSNLDTTYYVTDKDVEAYIHFKKLLAESAKKEFSVEEIEPLSLKNGFTLGYLFNYNEGWEIISADKRCPLVLASSDEGTLNLDELPEGVLTWIHSLESDVLYMRTINGIPIGINEEQRSSIQASIDFWESILATQDFIERRLGMCYGTMIGDTDGYWELVSTEIINTETESTEHLITAPYRDFIQEDPYNIYCPVISHNSTTHAPAGCVAVAGSMMLGYLHDELGVPTIGPDVAYYSGTVTFPGPFTCIMNEHTQLWGNLYIPSTAAILIAYVGHLLNTDYGATGSSASAEDLVINVFDSLGISCVYRPFSETMINTSLRNGMPVIVSAKGTRREVLGYVYYQDGHSFIIDSYSTIKRTYRYSYEWHYTNPSSLPRPDIDPRIEIVVGSPVISAYRMRWGYGNSPTDMIPFAISGNWIIDDGDDEYNYIYERYMINNFTTN